MFFQRVSTLIIMKYKRIYYPICKFRLLIIIDGADLVVNAHGMLVSI